MSELGTGRQERLAAWPLSEPTTRMTGEQSLAGFLTEEAKRGSTEAASQPPGPQGPFLPTACQCHCRHVERWTRGLEKGEFEVEKPQAYPPDPFTSKANNVTMRGEPTAVPPELFQVKQELLKEPWKESTEGTQGLPPYPEGSELKPEDMDYESKEEFDKDGNCQSQGTVCETLCPGRASSPRPGRASAWGLVRVLPLLKPTSHTHRVFKHEGYRAHSENGME